MSPSAELHAALRAHFGFAAFRPGQEQAVRAAVAGRDVLVVMPTGAGKSLCYQLPALVRDDLTLVVSPLVSLMADQAQALARRAPGRVALINGQQGARANEAALAAAVRGEVRVLHVAPERFAAPGFLERLAGVRVGLFVVDEAHCVSHWGHDFRPDYLRLGEVARRLGAAAVVASTATATPQVAEDVIGRLGLRDPVRVTTGFDRPGLSFAVVTSSGAGARTRQVVAALRAPGALPAIAYVGTRRAADQLAVRLEQELGCRVVAYHAGLARAERARAQERFMGGEVTVVVATNAFGMGVDKADVRTVVHAAVPTSLEAYYQEAGRAGRDGAPARAILFAAAADKGLHVHFVRRALGAAGDIAAVALALQAAAGGQPAAALPGLAGPAPRFDVAVGSLGADAERSRAVVGLLGQVGVVRLSPAPPDRVAGELVLEWDDEAARACGALAAVAQEARRRHYRDVWSFVESGRCRRAALLTHFGDPSAPAPSGPCCDVCAPALVAGLDGPGAGGAPDPRPALGREDLAADVRALEAAAGVPLAAAELADALHGRLTPAIRAAGLDGTPQFGTWDHLGEPQLLAAVAALGAPAGALAA